MLDRILAQRTVMEEHNLNFLAGVPVVFHCHHFNLFLDQTIDDALGTEVGSILRTEASEDAAYHLLSSLAEPVVAVNSMEKLELSGTTFSAMGQGRLTLDVSDSGGTARGEFLHYGTSWMEKYGGTIGRKHPADAFTGGFAAGATEMAFGLPRETVQVLEKRCVALRDLCCEFHLSRGTASSDPAPFVGQAESTKAVMPTFSGRNEDRIVKTTASLSELLSGVRSDERGLVQAFGVFITLHPANYYNRISYDTIRQLEGRTPKSVPILETLMRESGHVCVFNTFGGILLSPEWEGVVGPLRRDAEEIVTGCCAIARALGFGRWTLAELEPEVRLVIRTPSTYESSYHSTREKIADRGKCYFFQGAALAIMQLAHRVPWDERPELTPQVYRELFKSSVPWVAEETRCISRGDDMCEVIVSRAGAS